VLLVLAIGLNPVSWWRFRKAKPSLKSGRGLVTFLALLANSVALVFPFVFAFYMPLQSVIDVNWLLIGILTLGAFSSVASFFGLRPVGLPLLVSSVATTGVWLMVPIGVL
jgi:hypothetical protein